ncbi:hypothetical protein [Desulfotignum balticum]|uniref:hypothetical protein n=1 Tax=Desulfotignum balticum TaxID=115781 RepID=UPI0004627BD2|nr:hypothetical protein [Desulfotignum balticum]
MSILKTTESSTRDGDDLVQDDAFISEKAFSIINSEFERGSDTEDSLIDKLRLLFLQTYEEDFIKSATTKQPSLKNQTETLADACKSNTEQLKNNFVQNLLQLLHNVEFEFGYETPAEKYVREALSKYGTFVREWINDIFLQSLDDPQTLSGILRVISHFEYSLMYPQGMTIAISATRHEDAEVQECGIRCFENWEAIDSLPILKNIYISESWLNDYLKDVITDLEGLNT